MESAGEPKSRDSAKEIDQILSDLNQQTIEDPSLFPPTDIQSPIFGQSSPNPQQISGFPISSPPSVEAVEAVEENNHCLKANYSQDQHRDYTTNLSQNSLYTTNLPFANGPSHPQQQINNQPYQQPVGFNPTQHPAQNGTQSVSTTPFLIVIEQPGERCRFRYKAEQGPHGSLRSAVGKKHKSCPKVQFINVNNTLSNLRVVAQLFTNESHPRPHVNDLWGTNCTKGVSQITADVNGIALFPNLGIMRQKEKDVGDVLYQKFLDEEERRCGYPLPDDQKEILKDRANKEHVTMKDCLHAVRIGFTGYMKCQRTGQEYVTPTVFSDPIYNSQNPGFAELRIAEIDKSHGSALGGDTIWMRCASKIRRDQIKIRFHEPSTGWESFGIFSVNEVYEQILIIFKTPAYRDVNTDQKVHVNIHLFRDSDGEQSPPVDFVYIPLDEGNTSTSDRNNGFSQTKVNEEFSLTDLKSLSVEGEVGLKKMEKTLCSLWENHLQALWAFASEGDPQTLMLPSRHLIGWHDEDGTTALHVAVRNQQSFALKTLLSVMQCLPEKASILNAINFRKQTPLHQAIRFSDPDCVHYLITSGAERSLVDNEGNTAAHYLADTFNEAIYRDILFPPKDTVAAKQILDLGWLNNAGYNPVHLAVLRMKMVLLETLIEAKAPLNVKERNSGKTALYLAVEAGDTDIVELLLKESITVDEQANDGSTSLHVAVKKKEEQIISKLISAGANPDLKSAHWDLDESHGSDEIGGSSVQLLSPRDLIDENDERMTKLLNGEQLDDLAEPKNRLTESMTGIENDEEESQPGPSSSTTPNPSSSSNPEGNSSSIFRNTSPEIPTEAMKDDLGSLDFLTRLRLSKLLDGGGRWEKVANSLQCQHMIELIQVVCASSDEPTSPTILFLDQYEHVPGATVSSLVISLQFCNEGEAVDLIMKKSENELGNQSLTPSGTGTGTESNTEAMEAE